jgi:type IV pilus assembly protein PilY1
MWHEAPTEVNQESMMKKWITRIALIAVAIGVPMQAAAEDIDLFLGPTPPQNTSAPNVLFVIDNTGNWTSPFEDEKTALQSVFGALKDRLASDPNFAINIGLMMFTETGGEDSGEDGGYIRAAIRPMGEEADGEVYADLYSDLIGGFHVRDDKANAGAAGLAMAEAYYYFSGLAPHAGNNKAKTDWGNAAAGGAFNQYYNHSNAARASCCAESHPVWELPGNALTTKAGATYNSPVAEGSCGKNYIIWISNGATQDPSAGGSRPIPKQLLDAAAGTDVPEITLNPSGSQETWADEWSRFMKQSDAAVTTFTVDVLPKSTGQGPGWSEMLRSMAEESGGYAYTVTDANAVASELAAAVAGAIDRILAVNTVFASVALPAATNAQSTFLNQVFIGQFRPDADAHPRWMGNLKQYKLGVVGNTLKVLDADTVDEEDAQDEDNSADGSYVGTGNIVVDNGTGFITNCATSYWSTADTYWSGDLALDMDESQCSASTATSNAPDGPIVEKGGQAQMLRATTPASRTVYTCDTTFATCGSTSVLTAFNTSNGAVTAALSNDTINWGRGADIDDEDGDEDPTDMRASVHGDVVHSRPVAINYNTDANPQIVVYYSGNDGMLRAINGNRPDIAGRVDFTGVAPGEELWAFMPPEFYGHLDTLRDNTALVNYPSSSSLAPTTGISKPYGIDGPITAFEGYVPAATADKKYLFAGMRRAGRAIYAFDVTSATAPKMLWKVGCPNFADNNDCTTGFTDIGQTWSQANVMYARNYKVTTAGIDTLKPMLIVGGGYDDCEDTDNNSTANHACSGGTKGNAIYVMDAHSGALLKTFSTDRAVAGAVTVVPYGENDPGAMYAYAADTGGNIYRISGGTTAAPAAIDTTAPGSWVIKKIASLGCADPTTSCTGNRKFLFGPDVVRDPTYTTKFTVLLGSGDREKPLNVYGAAAAVQNYFFSVVDVPTDADWLDDGVGAGAVCGADIICLAGLTPVTTDGVADGVTLAAHGWRFPLAAGEQVVTGAITVADVANFSTHIAAETTDACASNLGTATAYNLNYSKGKGSKNTITKGGLVPTPVAGMVILDNGEKVPFCIGCGGEDSAIGAKLVGTGITWTQPKSRVYWNIQQ